MPSMRQILISDKGEVTLVDQKGREKVTGLTQLGGAKVVRRVTGRPSDDIRRVAKSIAPYQANAYCVSDTLVYTTDDQARKRNVLFWIVNFYLISTKSGLRFPSMPSRKGNVKKAKVS